MNSKVDDVRARVIKLEAREYERQIEGLSDRLGLALKRINDFEGTRDQQRGAKGLIDWVRQTVPWLLAVAAAAFAGISRSDGAPT